MEKHWCHVCRKLDLDSKLVKASFTGDDPGKTFYGHKLCFETVNKELCESTNPFRWKIQQEPLHEPQ